MWTLRFSFVGLLYLLMLWVPNVLWARKKPEGYDPGAENKVLLFCERTGQVCCTFFALCFSNDAPWLPFTAWTLWLGVSFLLMLLYEVCWVRYFRGGRQLRDFYRPFLGLPVPLASLPVFAFLLLGVYGRVWPLVLSAVLLGVGHMGIHLQHLHRLRRGGQA